MHKKTLKCKKNFNKLEKCKEMIKESHMIPFIMVFKVLLGEPLKTPFEFIFQKKKKFNMALCVVLFL
jgi:hypothetical protein